MRQSGLVTTKHRASIRCLVLQGLPQAGRQSGLWPACPPSQMGARRGRPTHLTSVCRGELMGQRGVAPVPETNDVRGANMRATMRAGGCDTGHRCLGHRQCRWLPSAQPWCGDQHPIHTMAPRLTVLAARREAGCNSRGVRHACRDCHTSRPRCPRLAVITAYRWDMAAVPRPAWRARGIVAQMTGYVR